MFLFCSHRRREGHKELFAAHPQDDGRDGNDVPDFDDDFPDADDAADRGIQEMNTQLGREARNRPAANAPIIQNNNPLVPSQLVEWAANVLSLLSGERLPFSSRFVSS